MRLAEREELGAISCGELKPSVQQMYLILREDGMAALRHVDERVDAGRRRDRPVREVLILKLVAGVDLVEAPETRIDAHISGLNPAVEQRQRSSGRLEA